MKINGRLVRFSSLPKADVVIFDETNHQLVLRAINKRYTTDVFRMRPEMIFINKEVFIHFFRRLFRHNVREESRNSKGRLFGLLRYLRHLYIEACLISMRPKAVVTFIDNDGVFHWLSRNCDLFPFIAIQNGTRLRYMAISNGTSGYYLQHLCSYGTNEVGLFPQLGYHVEHFYPVGSLLASLNFEFNIPIPELYDMLVVSTWRGNIGFTQEVQDTMQSMEKMDRLLASYIRASGIKAAVILRAERDSQHWFMPELGKNEKTYFEDIYGNCAEIIETNFTERNIFPLIQQSKVIVSCLSSALYEAFGIGKKVLFCNFTGSGIYHQDIHPSILTTNEDLAGFSTELTALLNIPQEKYTIENAGLMKYYMSFPEDKRSYLAISAIIDDLISA